MICTKKTSRGITDSLTLYIARERDRWSVEGQSMTRGQKDGNLRLEFSAVRGTLTGSQGVWRNSDNVACNVVFSSRDCVGAQCIVSAHAGV